MANVDWNRAAKQWEQLVREQESGPPLRPGAPNKKPNNLPESVCIFFFLSWFALTMVSGDWKAISCAFATIACFWWVGYRGNHLD